MEIAGAVDSSFNKEISLAGGRFQSCLKEIRSRAADVEDEEKVVKISKKDWENLHVHIASGKKFPTAAGLASSAAGFACLVFSLAKLMNVKEDQGQLSAIARQEDEIMELLWQNGQVVLQSQNPRLNRKSPPSNQRHQPPAPPPTSDSSTHLFMQEDEMDSWLQYDEY